MAKRRKAGAMRFGALLVLSACFVASALIRAGDVIAALPEGQDDGFGNPIPQASPDVSSAGDGNPAQVAGPEELVQELNRQRKDLKEREREGE